MIFAAIGRIGGDDRALTRALDAIAEEGLHLILHTGDAVAGGGGANQVMDLLQERGVHCVQGNTDRLVVRYARKQDTIERKLEPEQMARVREANEALTSPNLERLRDWRKNQTLSFEGLTMFLCHGSPGNPREQIDQETPIAKLRRQRELAHTDIVVCGGAEAGFSCLVDGTLFVVPGPLVGEDGTLRYTVVNTEEAPWQAMVATLPAS